jgi:uncharacterized protein YndB with AHSA1/START domain
MNQFQHVASRARISSPSVARSSRLNAPSSHTRPCGDFRNRACTCTRMMRPSITPIENYSNGTAAVSKGTPGADRLTVYLEANIRADARRLFYALTGPEYLETWLSFPGHECGCSTFATVDDYDYMIVHLCQGTGRTAVTGRYRVRERRNVVLSWRLEGIQSLPESNVDIRLSGNFEYTTLVLRHTGFDSWRQYLWHRSMWSRSLERLGRLFDSCPVQIFSHPRSSFVRYGI